MKQKLRQKATNQMPDEKNTIQIEKEFGCLFLGLYGKKHMGIATRAYRDSRATHVQLYSCTLDTRRHLHRVNVLFTGQILHKQLLNLLKSTVYTITNVARCSARQLRAPPQRSPYAPAVPTRLAGQGRTHRHHLPLPPYSLSESSAAKAQPQ